MLPKRLLPEFEFQGSLSDDELCAWWASEGSTSAKGDAQSHFEYVTQDDRDFVLKVCKELRHRGYNCKLVRVKQGSYSARANHASAFKFIKDIILPRRNKIPWVRYKKAVESYRRLKRTMGRGLGKDIKGRLR